MVKRLIAAFLFMGISATTVEAQSFLGSPAAMAEQLMMAKRYDYTRLYTKKQLDEFVRKGYLVKVNGNANYSLSDVQFPYTRPGTLLFIQRISRQYKAHCGEKLVVTSLTRPVNYQPRNASRRSVHPHGMSVDFRVPRCENWLKNSLGELERANLLEATREKRPPHWHVAVYTLDYEKFVKRKTAPKKPTPKKTVKKPVKKAPVKKAPARKRKG